MSDDVIDIAVSPFGRWGRYNEQIVIDLNSVARTAIACKGELISIALCAMEFLISIAAPP